MKKKNNEIIERLRNIAGNLGIFLVVIVFIAFVLLCFYVIGKFIEAVENFVSSNFTIITIVVVGILLIYFVGKSQNKE